MKTPKKRRKKRTWVMGIILSGMMVLMLGLVACVNQSRFGSTPNGERLERIKKSPNYRDDRFQNISPTEQLTSERSKVASLLDFMFRKIDRLRPDTDLPTIKTDLKQLARDQDTLVWMGHSSLFLQTDGKRFLIDPVLVMASPVTFVNKPFKGTEIYKPEDMPDIDYLVITHDHWDHLDYDTVRQLKDRTGKVICGLGVGTHLEYWGFSKDRIIELDWNESAKLDDGITFHCFPARHFSGRSFSPNKTLWISLILQSPSRTIYIGGDSGYDTHFAQIGKQFKSIDLAILENGQYNEDWKYIHLLPDELVKASKDLNAKRLLTVHNSKYALGKHPWDEPLINISQAAEKESLNLITPKIGEPVRLNDPGQTFEKWWESVPR